jgi:hypothetical protein
MTELKKNICTASLSQEWLNKHKITFSDLPKSTIKKK